MSNRVTGPHSVEHPHELPGVTLAFLGVQIPGFPEATVVSLEPNGEIPRHSHKVSAMMIITGGSGVVLADDPTNGQEVCAGSCVFFEEMRNHGFRAGREGLIFLSLNGGISGPGGLDLQFASA